MNDVKLYQPNYLYFLYLVFYNLNHSTVYKYPQIRANISELIDNSQILHIFKLFTLKNSSHLINNQHCSWYVDSSHSISVIICVYDNLILSLSIDDYLLLSLEISHKLFIHFNEVVFLFLHSTMVSYISAFWRWA